MLLVSGTLPPVITQLLVKFPRLNHTLARGIVSKFQRAVELETGTSEIVNECLCAVRKFGTVSLIVVSSFHLAEKTVHGPPCDQADLKRFVH